MTEEVAKQALMKERGEKGGDALAREIANTILDRWTKESTSHAGLHDAPGKSIRR